MMSDKYYVYVYFDRLTNLPMYVGKGHGNRAYKHLALCQRLDRNTRFYNKLRNLLRDGNKPRIEIVASGLSEKTAFDLEVSLISSYGRLQNGGVLYNLTDGGEGVSGVVPWNKGKKNIYQSESLEKISKSLKEYYSKNTPPRLGASGLKYWDNPKADDKAWVNLDLFYSYYLNGINTDRLLSSVFPEIGRAVFRTVLSYFDVNGDPSGDQRWVEYRQNSAPTKLKELPFKGISDIKDIKTHSKTLDIYKLYKEGKYPKEISDRLGVTLSTVQYIFKRFRKGWNPSSDRSILFLDYRVKLASVEEL